MQMAASAFDILIGSVSDNIGLRWVWTNQRCNRTVGIHRMQFKGLTFPTSVWQRKNGLCITSCWRYEAFQNASQIWKSLCKNDRPFSSSTWSGRLFFCSKKFRVGIPLQTERVVLFALFTKVSLAFSDKLPKVSYFQNFLLTRLNFCGSLSQQFNITYLLRVQARLSQKSEQVFNFLIAT